MSESEPIKPIHIVACGVLRLDFDEVAKRLGVDFETTYLEGGLHEDPARLRLELQQAIDSADSGECERIIIGYGLCGRGTVGIKARSKPLVIPRVHDCIALFLGADSAYRSEFARCPGTYYTSAGWYEEKVQPRGGPKHVAEPVKKPAESKDREYLADRYGEENADEILHFLSSWQRNYSRSAFIDTGAGRVDRYESYAKALAHEFEWQYERLDGSQTLLEKSIRSDASDGEILIVSPGFITDFDARERKLVARPVAAELSGGVVMKTQTPDASSISPPLTATVASNDGARGDDKERSHSIGLGIDAGGTYTDAVVFDFSSRVVLDKGKALTTKWDYSDGIEAAMDQIDERWFGRIDLVSVSTTLATNAIVEGTGQKTGLIIMPHGVVDTQQLHDPVAIVSGRIDISGNEVEPIDPDEIARCATEMREKHDIGAFAVSGYGGSVNPMHEIEVKRIIEQTTGCDVCCGHELSNLLGFAIRANTAVLNAGIIPLLERFLVDVERGLAARGISATVMVVKGDGTLMHSSLAREHPVETILSGPAASIAGARYLTDCVNATVIDVGGTTSDLGKVVDGTVRICADGAEVGRWRTHVKAIDMHTVGLGGDSQIYFERQELFVGPRRIAPVSWLSQRCAGINSEISYIHDRIDDVIADTRITEFLWSTGRKLPISLTDQEKRVLSLLEDGPKSLLHLVELTGCGHIRLLRTERIEAEYIVQRCGLTPTDILHKLGRMNLWDREAAAEFVGVIAKAARTTADEFSETVMGTVTEKLVFELVRRQLDENEGDNVFEDAPTTKALLDVFLTGGNRHLRVGFELAEPVIGLGAAAPLFLNEPAKHLHAKLTIPDFAEVANAVGAITSMVSVVKIGSVVPASDGMYHLVGVAGTEKYPEFDEAYKALVRALETAVVREAEAAGTDERDIAIDVHDRISATADGMEVFLERQVSARITGAPVALK